MPRTRALRIVAATVTRARDDAEQDLIFTTLSSLAATGMPVVAADGGSPQSFLDRLRQIEGVSLVFPERPGLVRQVHASVDAALGTPATHILYLESDKALFVAQTLGSLLGAADDETALLLAARSPEAFATFPPFQRRTEGAFNAVASDVLGVVTDYLYGPFLMNRAVAALAAGAHPDAGWGWRPFVFAAARARGETIRAAEGDFVCPPQQRTENDEERTHRLQQLRQNIDGLLQGVRASGGPPS